MADRSVSRFALMTLTTVGVSVGFVVGRGAGEAQPARTVTVAAPELVSDFDPSLVVARVGGRELTLEDLLVRYATAPAGRRFRYESSGRGLGGFLEDTVANLALADAAREMGVEDDPLFATLLEIHREEVLRDLYARRTVLAQVDDATLRRRYEDQKRARFERTPRLRLRHILVTPVEESPPPNSSGDDAVGREAALDKTRRLRHQLSESDFADLARRYSEDASAAEGGDLGWVTRDELVPELADAARSLRPGEISDVVETSLGFHLIEVLDLRRGGLVPYRSVRELLYQEIVGEQAPYFAGLAQKDREARLAEAEVEMFPERLPW